jgi:hypothetical protein
MANEFPRDQVDELLTACHRRCCICHRFCGVKMETDHMQPTANGGTNDIINAIPVCFECHAEIHSYNVQHPRGRKFRPEELRLHKEQWLMICRTKPEKLLNANWNSDVGPLQALIDELEFNVVVSEQGTHANVGCMFLDDQFRVAVRQGAIATLVDDLKRVILEAYRAMGAANQAVSAIYSFRPSADDPKNIAANLVFNARPKIEGARDALLRSEFRYIGLAE